MSSHVPTHIQDIQDKIAKHFPNFTLRPEVIHLSQYGVSVYKGMGQYFYLYDGPQLASGNAIQIYHLDELAKVMGLLGKKAKIKYIKMYMSQFRPLLSSENILQVGLMLDGMNMHFYSNVVCDFVNMTATPTRTFIFDGKRERFEVKHINDIRSAISGAYHSRIKVNEEKITKSNDRLKRMKDFAQANF